MQNLIKIALFIAAIFLLVKAYDYFNTTDTWPETDAVISWHEVEHYQDKQDESSQLPDNKAAASQQRVTFGYTFKVDGNDYDGFFKIDKLDSASKVDEQLRLYPQGKTINVKYDPDDPLDNTIIK